MAQRVGDYLKHDPLRLRFTSANANNLGPKAVIKRALNQSVGDLTQTGFYAHQHVNLVLYYEKLDVSIIELETKKSLKITWTGSHNKEEVSRPLIRANSYVYSHAVIPVAVHPSILAAQDQHLFGCCRRACETRDTRPARQP
jgi:ubiquitin carboxyl-terminal hydrolase 7